MNAKVGDRVSLDSKKVGQPRRTGVIARVARGLSGERFEIRWDDGATSIIAPSAGTLFVEGKGSKTKPKAKAQVKGAAKGRAKANGKKRRR